MPNLASLEALDEYFLDNSFVCDQKLSVADLAFASTLQHMFDEKIIDSKESRKYRNLNRYLTTLKAQPEYRDVANLKLFKSTKASGDASPKSSAEESADLLEQLEKSKPKDPWASLPVGKFDFDDFKRNFSNNPEDVSIPYFWSKFDPEHYSIWASDYNYNDELGLTFMSCNLIGGMYQRIEKMRKAAFASMCVWGEDHKNIIAGVWVWRGQDLAFKLTEDWQVDYESYTWRKLDPNAEETKQLVDTFFRRGGTYKGYKYCDGKIFK
ncbi:hypothetical protein GZH46_00545, partial [Fragariocoptes setiger]